MNDFISEDMKVWRKNFRVNSKTSSANNKMKTLYDIILKNEMSDSDYWYFVGANDFITYLTCFNANDIKELIEDIPNWTERQKWILRDCLTYGGMQYSNHRESITFEYQSFLLTYLFSLTTDEDIKIDIFESAEIIYAGKPKPYHLLLLIKTWADNQIKCVDDNKSNYSPDQRNYQLIEAALEKANYL